MLVAIYTQYPVYLLKILKQILLIFTFLTLNLVLAEKLTVFIPWFKIKAACFNQSDASTLTKDELFIESVTNSNDHSVTAITIQSDSVTPAFVSIHPCFIQNFPHSSLQSYLIQLSFPPPS